MQDGSEDPGTTEMQAKQQLVNDAYFELQASLHEFSDAKDDFHHDMMRNQMELIQQARVIKNEILDIGDVVDSLLAHSSA